MAADYGALLTVGKLCRLIADTNVDNCVDKSMGFSESPPESPQKKGGLGGRLA
jgi:hypothetical protein